ncbi:Methyltransferase [Caenorhabditis elegans]|uniref:Methyltransferase n=1 Tax=Caenorhabditis elegans TaxID=6239 RepID=A0A5E4LXU4_CAEEL|nr:Methyltransferase [Caenorhabditis elegans]VVC12372.1 Methyltransferase [Caenorhabditis elegans]
MAHFERREKFFRSKQYWLETWDHEVKYFNNNVWNEENIKAFDFCLTPKACEVLK